jgi:hypothetical protein
MKKKIIFRVYNTEENEEERIQLYNNNIFVRFFLFFFVFLAKIYNAESRKKKPLIRMFSLK